MLLWRPPASKRLPLHARLLPLHHRKGLLLPVMPVRFQLAHRLRRLGVGPDTRVGISLQRGPEMATAVLGTLEAGGACVPLDPAYPEGRLRFILSDCGAAVLITDTDASPPAIVSGSIPTACPKRWIPRRINSERDSCSRSSS